MIYSSAGQWCFLHVPRTAGTSITAALAAAWPAAIRREDADAKHATAGQAARYYIGDAWPALEARAFLVVRNPWDLIRSDWLYCRAAAATMPPAAEPPPYAPTAEEAAARWWQEKCARAAGRPFLDFVRSDYLEDYRTLADGGFWRTFAHDIDGARLVNHVFRYEDLAGAWPRIAELTGRPLGELPRLNASPPAGRDEAQWDRATARAIGALCCDDVARFGYVGPETLDG
jgi:hypothetical protein